jgi:malate dehydrogenase (oxaloacetate-decarboxylating)
MNYNQRALELHSRLRGKLESTIKAPIENKDDLSVVYSPGVAEPCRKIAENPDAVYDYTIKGNTVAIISDGSAVLGLGNIGPLAAMPVMEGKAALLKRFAGVDAWPIVLDTQDPEEIISIVKAISPSFGGINLEDISAPRCFVIEKALQGIGIPVFHDDQHGTAIVTLAGLYNACRVIDQRLDSIKLVVAGAGAAGIAIINLLEEAGVQSGNIVLVDSKGIVHSSRDNLNEYKEAIAVRSNSEERTGDLSAALLGADVFIGVSKAGTVTREMVGMMADNPILFAMANPEPEIMPDIAKEAGAAVVATGRSDFPNQVNNVLAFPGIFRGALDARAQSITTSMKLAAAKAIAELVETPTSDNILPDPFDERLVGVVASAVKQA